MKKDVSVNYHLDNLVEFREIIISEFTKPMYFVYPVFWYDSDTNRPYLSICFTTEPHGFSDSITFFPPDCACTIDLYAQLSTLLLDLKSVVFDLGNVTFALQKLEYKDV